MKYNDITSLRQVSETKWEAKYNGNYGTYVIKIELDGNKISKYKCSCPSSYQPCKHIFMVKDEIDAQMTKSQNEISKNITNIEDILKTIPQKKLVNFLIKQAKFNEELKRNILIEFADLKPNISGNTYKSIIRKELSNLNLNLDDMYDYEDPIPNIDILDEMFGKAKEFITQKRYNEASKISKACIEEFAEWFQDLDSEITEYIDPIYNDKPFEILREIINNNGINKDELFKYCVDQLSDNKYKNTEIFDNFNDLMNDIVSETTVNEFIKIQNKLFEQTTDKSSREAQNILERKISFYKKIDREDKAQNIMESNLQIESFRKQIVLQKISENKLVDAKNLINELFNNSQNKSRDIVEWKKLLIKIAQLENDISTLRIISYQFIEKHFILEYYNLYKSTFKPEEWQAEVKQLIKQYKRNDNYFNEYIADIYIAENDQSELFNYVQKYLTLNILETYYLHFVSKYTNETIVFFKKLIADYAAQNTGRSHYEYIVRLLNKMAKIEGGKIVVSQMINQFKTQYTNRRAMIEVLNSLQL